jgi:uncharacterized protein YdcH (DUF465 family)
MPVPLEEWQKRLDAHFTQLARSRSSSDIPIFALEHNFTAEEFREISTLLKERLSLGLRLETHWLLWVVYATELGYDYDGDEYWHSFEERTPRWKDRGSRNQLRDWFSRFRLSYHGVKPTGPWAEWFRIIAWPITHAILPRYLQWQFAKALYNLRYRLAQLRDPNPATVGQLLAAHAWDASSRFREFLQQEELAGRIVLALVGNTNVAGQDSIQPATLQRIVADLERVQSAREWLKETQRYVADRISGTGRPASASHPEYDTEDADAHRSLSIRPRLMLRPNGAGRWSLIAEVPPLTAIARLNPELHAFLLKTRCKITGSGETWLPNAWLLSGTQRRVLKSWPGAGAPLISFEKPNAQIEQLLSGARISEGPVWLFRIGADGLAAEIVGKTIRPGRRYVLVSDRDVPSDHGLFTSCDVDCAGIRGGLLSTPETLSSDAISLVEGMGLQVARTVRIWPAGLPARAWDGEGNSEWLTTDRPCFGIAHDHAVDSYTLRLDNGAEVAIKPPPLGNAAFVALPPLAPGQHTLSVRTQRMQALPSAAAEGVVTLSVREPEPWVPGTTSHAGLFVSVEPSDPPLDLFWEGDVSIGIMGPPGHRVTCTMTLLTPKKEPLLSEAIGTFDLPVTNEEWQLKFRQFVGVDKREWAYLEASSGSLSIKEDELGDFTLRLDRDVKPVRWVCRSDRRITIARLIDDTGLDDSAACRFFSLRCPADCISIDTDKALSGIEIPGPGGLYGASHADFEDAIVVSMPQVEEGLRGLVIEPNLSALDGEKGTVTQILEILSLWIRARLFGPLVSVRRRRIVERLLNRLYGKLCGKRWSEAEAAFHAQPQSESVLKKLEHAIGGTPGFGVLLRRDHARFEAGSAAGIQWFAEIAARYKVCTDRGLCEFALRLGSEPHGLGSLPKPVLDPLLTEIKDKTILLRGARFLALLSANAQSAAGISRRK